MNEEIYKENILEHTRHPHNNRKLSDFDISQNGQNVNCGDDITIYIKLDKQETVKEISFEGDGCAISISATSMLMDKIKNLSMEEVKSLTEQDVYDMLGISIGGSREGCALLSLNTIKGALNNYEKK